MQASGLNLLFGWTTTALDKSKRLRFVGRVSEAHPPSELLLPPAASPSTRSRPDRRAGWVCSSMPRQYLVPNRLAVDNPRGKSRLGEAQAVLAATFDRIHGVIGAFDERFAVVAMIPVEDDADAGADLA